jgi:hypothetical protein
LRRYLSAPNLKERFFPLHLGLPRGSAVVSRLRAFSPTLPYRFAAAHLDHAGQPYEKGLTIMSNSTYNGWRFEDVWLDK